MISWKGIWERSTLVKGWTVFTSGSPKQTVDDVLNSYPDHCEMQLSCISFRHRSKKTPKTLSPVTVISTQEKVIPPMTLSLKRNKNVPLFFFFKRDFSLPLVTKPMMSLKHKRNFILKGKHFRFHGHWSYELNWDMHINNRVIQITILTVWHVAGFF